MAALDDDNLVWWGLGIFGLYVLWTALRDAAATESTTYDLDTAPAKPGANDATIPFVPAPPDEGIPDAILNAAIPQDLSPEGEAFIKKQEGLTLTPKPDAGGGRVIGYGHYLAPGDGWKGSITQAQAEAVFQDDASHAIDLVHKAITVPLAQNQFDALVDLGFNIPAALGPSSSVVTALNAGDYKKAAANIQLWNKSDGRVNLVLVKRRRAESQAFNTTGGTS